MTVLRVQVANVLLPSSLLVCICYLSFFIARAAVPARVAINAITFLAISGFTGVVLRSLPAFAGDVWLLQYLWVGMSFVAFANLEYAAANMLMRAQGRVDKACAAFAKDVETARELSASSVSVEVAQSAPPAPAAAAQTVRAAIYYKVGRFDRILLRGDGTMWIKDEFLDITCRWLYLPAYLIAVLVQASQLDEWPLH